MLPESPVPIPVPQPLGPEPGELPEPRVHLVVVRTWLASAPDPTEIVARYWHPGRRAWQDVTFESLEHAMRMFVQENGWELRQQQPLDGPGVQELIFAARRGDFDQPSARELLLEEVGLSSEDAEAMLDRVDERADRPDR
jgi:hypothetical protein